MASFYSTHNLANSDGTAINADGNFHNTRPHRGGASVGAGSVGIAG